MSRFICAAVAACVLLGAAGDAVAKRYRVTNGGLYAGIDYFTPTDETRYGDFVYPIFGFLYDHEYMYGEISTIFPFLIVDTMVALVRFLGGGDTDFPMMQGWNGKEEPGRMRLLAASGRYSLLRGDGAKIEVGLAYDLAYMGAYFDPALPREEVRDMPGQTYEPKHVGNVINNLAATIGFGFRSDAFSTNFALAAGNGMGSMSNWSPFVGFEAMNRVRFGEHIGGYLRLCARFQNMDYSGYEFKNSSDAKNYDLDFNEWVPMVSFDIGLVFAIVKTKKW